MSKGHSAEEEDLGFLRTHWIIVDRKSLATISNAKGVGGWQTLLTNFVYKPLSPITPLTRFPNVSFWTFPGLGLSQLRIFLKYPPCPGLLPGNDSV